LSQKEENMKPLYAVFVLAAATLGPTDVGLAQDRPEGHQMGQAAETVDSPATRAFREANDRMHRDMGIAFTGNVDADFVRGMIPHHQGAIDMAQVLLEHGKDPELRKLAEAIIAAQEAEIAMMRAWLAANAPDSADMPAAMEESMPGMGH
jgi:uncharacterized protein (DUF305 family)